LGRTEITPDDRSYLVRAVMTPAGLTQAEVEAGVNKTFADSKTAVSRARREIGEELRLRFWKEVKAKNHHSGRKMSDAIFIAKKASGRLAIGDKREIDRAMWWKPRGIRLTPTTRYIRNKLFPN
jgi:8-oxo-dGTP diphosphatase